MRDPYSVLGVKRSAGQEEIKAAWRSLAKAVHPDQNHDDPNATVRLGGSPTSSAASAAPAKAQPAAGSQRLLIRAVEPSWIRVQTDDGRVVEELLPAGASREWATERRFLVSIGNAGGVEVTVNGKVLPVLGGRGAVIHRLELPASPAAPGS